MRAADNDGPCRRSWQWTAAVNKVDRSDEHGWGRLERRGLVAVEATVPDAS